MRALGPEGTARAYRPPARVRLRCEPAELGLEAALHPARAIRFVSVGGRVGRVGIVARKAGLRIDEVGA